MSVIKIKPVHKETQGDYVLIAEENFDSEIHELYTPTKKEAPKKRAINPKNNPQG